MDYLTTYDEVDAEARRDWLADRFTYPNDYSPDEADIVNELDESMDDLSGLIPAHVVFVATPDGYFPANNVEGE